MIKWPENKKNADEIYSLNEQGENGFYPVGVNNCWHSGIHIPCSEYDSENETDESGKSKRLCKQISPLLGGFVVAYRMEKEYKTVEKPTEISQDVYDHLPAQAKSDYELNPEKDPLKVYKLKESAEAEYKISNNFVILKHEVKLPSINTNETKSIIFFTMYMNLLPESEVGLAEKYKDPIPLSTTDEYTEAFPFYYDWIVTIKEDLSDIFYKISDKGENFIYSFFKIINSKSFMRELTTNIPLTNCKIESNGSIQDLSQHDVELGWVKVKTNKSDIKFYTNNQYVWNNDELENNCRGILNDIECELDFEETKEIQTRCNVPFSVIRIKSEHIKDYKNYSFLDCWIYTNQLDKIDGVNILSSSYDQLWVDSNKNEMIYKLKDGCSYNRYNKPMTFTRLTTDENNEKSYFRIITEKEYFDTALQYHDYKIFGDIWYHPDEIKIDVTGDNKFITGITRVSNPDIKRPKGILNAKKMLENGYRKAAETRMLVVRNPAYMDFTSSYEPYPDTVGLVFYYTLMFGMIMTVPNNKIYPIYIDRNQYKKVNRLEPRNIPSNLKAFLVKKIDHLRVDDTFQVMRKENPPDDLGFLQEKENVTFCKYYIQSSVERNWFVKTSDLSHIETFGRLKEKDEHVSSYSSESGLMVYDSCLSFKRLGKWEAWRNPREILEAGSEVELYDPASYFSDKDQRNGFIAIKQGDEIRDIYVPDKDYLTCKIDQTGCGEGIKEPENLELSIADSLGYPAYNIYGLKRTYDLILFLENADFIKPFSDGDAEISSYKIPSSTQFFKAEYNVPSFSHYVPPQCTEKVNDQWVPVYTGNTMVLKIEEEKGPEGLKGYKVSMDAILIYIIDGASRLVEGTTYEIVSEPTMFWLSGKKIDYSDIDATPQEIRPFADALETAKSNLVGKRYELVHQGGGGRAFLVDCSPGGINISLKFWVLQNELSGNTAIADNKINFSGGSTTLKYYEECPLTATMTNHTIVGAGSETLEFSNITKTAVDRNDDEYYGFKHEADILYLKKDDALSFKENLLDWEKYLTKNGNDTDGNIFCDIDGDIISEGTITTGEKTVSEGDIINLIDNSANKDDIGRITGRELKTIFNNMDEDDKIIQDIKKSLRRLVISHPLEWNSSLYEGFKDKLKEKGFENVHTDSQITFLENCAAATDMWDELSGVKTISDCQDPENSKNLWFTHPVYFINHLDFAGLFVWNPYANRKDLPGVKDTPGFAPRFKPEPIQKPSSYYSFMGAKYAIISGRFNADYYEIHKDEGYKYYYHEGVDFSAEYGTPVVSLVNAEVVRAGNYQSTSMGGYMIFKDLRNPHRYFVIVHLQNVNLDLVGSIVKPGQQVAEIGRDAGNGRDAQGNNLPISGPHLHVSVVEADSDDPQEVYVGAHGWGAWWSKTKNEDQKKAKDPFNYSIEWKGRDQ
ncbi:MAG: M23 family metallopeptidase [Spirochaetales bacterium]|nr:M23 family metallopeptidase [Spirochaetales bacterium]